MSVASTASPRPDGRPDAAQPSDAPSVAAETGSTENVGVIVIHGVGNAEIGWINDHIVETLGHHEPTMSFDPFSQVYRLPDKGRTKAGAIFRTLVRRARIGRRINIAFAELHWADLSRVGDGALTRFLTTLQLFFEAPHVLGSSLLAERTSGIHGLIRRLILISIWLLRWPIAGMTVSLFVASFCMMLIDKLTRNEMFNVYASIPLPFTAAGALAVTATLGLALARYRYRHDIALTDLGLATAMASLLMLLGLMVASAFESSQMHDRAAYLALIGQIIMAAFLGWNATIVSAMFLMLSVWVTRLFRRRPSGRPSLHRAAAAAGLSVMQGMLWKFVVCPVSLTVVFMLVDGGKRCTAAPCPQAVKDIFDIVDLLLLVAFSNAVMTFLVATSIALVVLARSVIASTRARALMSGSITLPRLIASRHVLVVLFVCQFVSVSLFMYFANVDSEFKRWVQNELINDQNVTGLRNFLTSTALLTLLPTILGALSKASTSVLHIVRDVVDHQYAPRQIALRLWLPRWLHQRGQHPRRERIQKRLDALMEGVIKNEPFDRLVFLTHSQGTVIMHDYLRSVRDEATLAHIKRIDIITLASPLSHLYQHYFRAYHVQTGRAAELNPKLASWTNMWRIDDPIGNRVDILRDNFIVNQPMPKGGHVNYWQEAEVCDAILAVLDPGRRVAPAPAAGAVAAATGGAPAAAERMGFPAMT